jgi:hypothetical protein
LTAASAGAPLDDVAAAEAHARAAEIDAAVHAPEPDSERAVGLLKRLDMLLADAGSLVSEA